MNMLLVPGSHAAIFTRSSDSEAYDYLTRHADAIEPKKTGPNFNICQAYVH